MRTLLSLDRYTHWCYPLLTDIAENNTKQTNADRSVQRRLRATKSSRNNGQDMTRLLVTSGTNYGPYIYESSEGFPYDNIPKPPPKTNTKKIVKQLRKTGEIALPSQKRDRWISRKLFSPFFFYVTSKLIKVSSIFRTKIL